MDSDAQVTWHNNRLLRVAGQHKPASQVISAAAVKLQGVAHFLTTIDPAAVAIDDDYAQIDGLLQVDNSASGDEQLAPPVGVGYAGLTPGQRGRFLGWLEEPSAPAPLAFQQLYLAQLEVGLLEADVRTQGVVRELHRLGRAPAWQQHVGLARTTLLAYWLTQDGAGLASWSADQPLPAPLAGVALGCQGLLGAPLRSEQVTHLAVAWGLAAAAPPSTMLNLRLRSLLTNLGGDPLCFALTQLSEEAKAPRLWRSHHRAVRLVFPQPDVRSILQPMLAEALGELDALPPSPASTLTPATPGRDEQGWHLIVEFGQSRSDLFQFALTLAQRQPGFQQILDENRKAVYRVIFKKNELRQFWRVWDYVQGWANTHVYLNGHEVEKWKVYPYSQFLK